MAVTRSNLQKLILEVREQWVPQPDQPLIEWLPDNIRLPAEDSDSAGYYKIESVPYFWGIMHALDSEHCWLVVMQKAAQIGWTVLLAAWICKVAKVDPSRILALFPKEEKGRKFMDEKFVPMINASPAMRSVIDTSTSRSSGNRTTVKRWPGGELTCVGSNSVSNVKSTTSRRGIVEEPDDTNRDIGDQGDSIGLFRERLKRMRKKKLVVGGTPSVADLSQVEHYTKLGTMRVLPVTCHDCGESHVLDWEYVSWDEKEQGNAHPVFGLALPDTAVYSCPHCGSVWSDYRRQRNILETCEAARDAGDPFCGWIKQQVGEGYGPYDEEPIETFVELSELYVCMPGTSLADVVRDYLEAEHNAEAGDESARIIFQNSKLGRPYQHAANQILDSDKLREAAEDRPELVCPAEGLMVTIGIDVQHDRLAIIIRAFGRNEESWQMYWGEIDGDTVDKNDPCWTALDKLVFQTFEHERFGGINAAAIGIDCSDGQTSNAVYHWVRTRSKKYRGSLVMAVKGDSNDQGTKEIFSLPKQVDRANAKRVTKADKFGVKVYMVGTHKAKDLISRRLLGTSAYMHSCKEVRQDYWEQVTAEVKAPSKKHRGKLVWQVRTGRRNEALDCFDAETEVMTQHGWRRFCDLEADNLLATVNLETDQIEYQRPYCVIDKPYSGEMVQLKGERLDILVTPNHRMVTHKPRLVTVSPGVRRFQKDVPPEITLAKDLTARHTIKLRATWSGEDTPIVVPALQNKHGTEIQPAHTIDRADLADFFGWFVSEGHTFSGVSATQGNRRYRVVISQNKPEGQRLISQVLNRLPWKWRLDAGRQFVINSKQLYDLVSECGGRQHLRRAPDWIKQSSASVIERFIDSAIKGDGWVRSKQGQREHRYYATTSKLLADDMQELFLKVGRSAHICTREPKPCPLSGSSAADPRLQYHVAERKVSQAYLDGGGNGRRGFLGRRVHYEGRVYCATVPNGTLIVRRNGKAFIAGNCEVYALHGAHARGMHKHNEAKWSEIEGKLGQRTLFSEPASQADDKPKTKKPRQSRPVGSLLN